MNFPLPFTKSMRDWPGRRRVDAGAAADGSGTKRGDARSIALPAWPPHRKLRDGRMPPRFAMRRHFLLHAELLRAKVPDWSAWPYCLPVVRSLETVEFHPKVTYFVGENGSGKSTLLEALAIAAGFNAEGGSRNFRFSTQDSHSGLSAQLRLARGTDRPRDGYFLRAESFYNVASHIDALDREPDPFSPPVKDSYGGTSLHEQSHGESFMALLQKRLHGPGLYFFDEPEAALSPTRQLALLRRIHELVLGGSQFVIATHSPIVLAYPEATLYDLDEGGLEPIAYDDTDHVRVMRRFLGDRQSVLAELLG